MEAAISIIDCKIFYRKSGVYLILDAVSGDSYVGGSKNIGKRIRSHMQMLLNSTHRNTNLKSVFINHGLNSLRIKMLEECNPSQLYNREQVWIDKINLA